jgi:endonuclease YncB( thermonuclease family)
MKRVASFSAISILLFLSMLILCVNGEVDKTSTVTRVIDGDTFDISTGERIRLADVDAPEYNQSGYSEATDYLTSMIDGKTVYLDVDDVYTYDYRGTGDRLVCVAYVDYDSTQLMNVNQALLNEGYAVISDYYNEFSPYSWSLFVPKDTSEPTQSPFPFTTPTPTATPERDSALFPEDILNVAVAIFAIGLVIVIFIILSKMGKKS